MTVWGDLFAMLSGTSSIVAPANVVDRRKYAAQAHGPERAWKVKGRSWADVTGVCLHQTACLLGERPERWDSVGAHAGITRGGQEIWLHDWNRIVAHGNGWNARTVGIEIDGLYAGVEGDEATVWNDPGTPFRERGMVLTQTAINAAQACIRRIVTEVGDHGGKIQVLVAHRQSSKDRRNDPGSAIWKHVALPLASEVKLSDGGIGFAIGGYPIPEAWDPRCVGIRY